MVRGAQYAYVALAWAYVTMIIAQVFLIGLGLFASREIREVHAAFGWAVLHLFPILILIAAALARAGRTRILQAAALVVLIFFVPILATLRTDAPVVAALHPVGAILAFWLATVVAHGATRLLRGTDPAASVPVAPIGG